MRERLTTIGELVGFISISAGFGMISWSLGLISAGLSLVFVSYVADGES